MDYFEGVSGADEFFLSGTQIKYVHRTRCRPSEGKKIDFCSIRRELQRCEVSQYFFRVLRRLSSQPQPCVGSIWFRCPYLRCFCNITRSIHELVRSRLDKCNQLSVWRSSALSRSTCSRGTCQCDCNQNDQPKDSHTGDTPIDEAQSGQGDASRRLSSRTTVRTDHVHGSSMKCSCLTARAGSPRSAKYCAGKTRRTRIAAARDLSLFVRRHVLQLRGDGQSRRLQLRFGNR